MKTALIHEKTRGNFAIKLSVSHTSLSFSGAVLRRWCFTSRGCMLIGHDCLTWLSKVTQLVHAAALLKLFSHIQTLLWLATRSSRLTRVRVRIAVSKNRTLATNYFPIFVIEGFKIANFEWYSKLMMKWLIDIPNWRAATTAAAIYYWPDIQGFQGWVGENLARFHSIPKSWVKTHLNLLSKSKWLRGMIWLDLNLGIG